MNPLESGEIKKYYEWINTSRIGKTEVYVAEDNSNIYFESGRIVPKDNFDYDLKQIDELVYLEKLKYQPQDLPIQESFAYSDIIANDPMFNQPNNLIQSVPTPVEQNPIKIILDKQKRLQKISVLVDFVLEVPTDKVINLLEVMFDQDEVIEQIIKSATEKIDHNAITGKITETIREKIESLFTEENDDNHEMPPT